MDPFDYDYLGSIRLYINQPSILILIKKKSDLKIEKVFFF